MDFEVLEKTETALEIKVKDADDTVMYPMIERLMKEEAIEDADYSVEHQELDDPILRIEVEEGKDPKELLLEISESFKDEFKEIYDDLFEEE